MPLAPIPLDQLQRVGQGVQRPEDVVVSRDGRVWLSDQASAAAEILPDGSLNRVGDAGGAPNGINMDAQGRIIIANVGGLDGDDPNATQDPSNGSTPTPAKSKSSPPKSTAFPWSPPTIPTSIRRAASGSPTPPPAPATTPSPAAPTASSFASKPTAP